MIASKVFWQHDFPAPHIDAVETVIDYRVSSEFFTPLAEFDGSVVVERTAGEVSARCHDVQANNLALNLMHDVVTGAKSSTEARDYYVSRLPAQAADALYGRAPRPDGHQHTRPGHAGAERRGSRAGEG